MEEIALFCRQCGNKLEDDAAFCMKCGTPTGIPPRAAAALERAEEAEPAPAPANPAPGNADAAARNGPAGKIDIPGVIFGLCTDFFISFLGSYCGLRIGAWGLINAFSSFGTRAGNIPYYREGIFLIAGLIAVFSACKEYPKILKENRDKESAGPFYKRLSFWATIVMLVVFSAIYNNIFDLSSPKNELRDYVENQYPLLSYPSSQISLAWNDVMGENYTDDGAVYAALKRDILSNAEEQLDKAEAIHPDDNRLAQIHDLFVDHAEALLEGYQMYLKAIEENDYYSAALGAEKIKEANEFLSEYVDELNDYCEEYDIDAKFETYTMAEGID